jgi:hypothetical protein
MRLFGNRDFQSGTPPRPDPPKVSLKSTRRERKNWAFLARAEKAFCRKTAQRLKNGELRILLLAPFVPFAAITQDYPARRPEFARVQLRHRSKLCAQPFASSASFCSTSVSG